MGTSIGKDMNERFGQELFFCRSINHKMDLDDAPKKAILMFDIISVNCQIDCGMPERFCLPLKECMKRGPTCADD